MIAPVTHLELDGGDASATISPADGGRLTSLRVNGRELIDSSVTRRADPLHWGSYPMAPWVGRTRRGRFAFAGIDYQLPINMEPHAIHGTTFIKSWRVVQEGSLALEIETELSMGDRSDWPFGGVARQRFELEPDALTCWLQVEAVETMPVEVGWHPWFVKPDAVDFHAAVMYLRDDDYVCDGRTVSPPPAPPWDDNFTDVAQPVNLRWGDLSVSITSSCDYWVVYDMPEHATCVEPQSGPANSLNLGPTVLQAGDTLSHWMRIAWS